MAVPCLFRAPVFWESWDTVVWAVGGEGVFASVLTCIQVKQSSSPVFTTSCEMGWVSLIGLSVLLTCCVFETNDLLI